MRVVRNGTLTLTPGPGVEYMPWREVCLHDGSGVRKAECKVNADNTATCPNVHPHVPPRGESQRLWTEVRTSGRKAGDIPHVIFRVGDLGSAQADFRLTD
ncbi:hypothetical protein V1J52_11000 [Streptomyces sp. TRM 70351]|uniref:hypothetical protein n=1 Tax=Streptomyces sp. TRM 70351 TaxID=3116552 RepID=UPI002E7B80AD|nr:hypothetical protein [Streptomyces sp. TRM 70351]MEE1928717.1 hypothetical protein [Streptomyces sp. TRM 70351]